MSFMCIHRFYWLRPLGRRDSGVIGDADDGDYGEGKVGMERGG
jgi:hypothetical protein